MEAMTFTANMFIGAETIFLQIVLFTVCSIGDRVVSLSSSSREIRACADSFTHGFVGLISWALVIELKTFRPIQIFQCVLCMFLAMAVDVDHFIAAKSLSLQDAVSIQSRPLFHASTIILPISAIIWSIGEMTHDSRLTILNYIYVLAWTSHHIRDATRRGLWLPPLGNTSPIPYALYVTGTCLLPLLFRFLWKSKLLHESDTRVVENV